MPDDDRPDDEKVASPKWLADLIGSSWPSNSALLSSARVMQLAERGRRKPASLSLLEIRELAASVIDHMARQERSSNAEQPAFGARLSGARFSKAPLVPPADH